MNAPSVLRAATGVEGLDDILHGGLIAGRLYLIDGSPGAGKTTLALQFLRAGVALGERCLYVTLSESQEELEAGARSHGWSLDGIEILELTADERELETDAQLTMYQPADVELGETTQKILRGVESGRPARMVLDSLSELRLLAQSSLRYRKQVLALKQFFRRPRLHRAAAGRPHRRRPRPAAAQRGARRDLARALAARLRPHLPADPGGEVPRQRLPQRLPRHRDPARRPRGVPAPDGRRARAAVRAPADRERCRCARRTARRRRRPRHDDAADRPAGQRQVDGLHPVRGRRRGARRTRGGLRVRRVSLHPARAHRRARHPHPRGQRAGRGAHPPGRPRPRSRPASSRTPCAHRWSATTRGSS